MLLAEQTLSSKEIITLALKVDRRFKHHLLNTMSNELNTLALSIVKSQLSSLDHIFTSRT